MIHIFQAYRGSQILAILEGKFPGSREDAYRDFLSCTSDSTLRDLLRIKKLPLNDIYTRGFILWCQDQYKMKSVDFTIRNSPPHEETIR